MKYIENNEELDMVMGNELTLVDFYADWCGPCKMLGPVLETLENDISIIKVNVDSNELLASKYAVMSIPTVIIFKDKKEVFKFIGYKDSEEILSIIKTLK